MQVLVLVIVVLAVLVGLSLVAAVVHVLKVLVVGLVIGALARALLPGRNAASLPMTMVYGVVGAVLGEYAARVLHLRGLFIELALQIGAAAALITLLGRRRLGKD